MTRGPVATQGHEWRLFPEGTVPECATADWYAGRERAPHLEQTAHRARLEVAARHIRALTVSYPSERGLTSLVDLGAGDGGLLSMLPLSSSGLNRAWGYDLAPANVDAAATERGVDVRYGDVLTGVIDWGEIAVCTEMLEHLVDPHGFVRTIREHSLAVVASSPANEDDRSHYEHHLWAWDLAGYAALFAQAGFRVIRHDVVGGAFQVVSAVAW